VEPSPDPVVAEHRERITAVDREILDAVNRRIQVVASLHAHKRREGYPTLDPGREQALIAALQAANPGPLSDEGLAQLYRLLLELCTLEAARAASPQQPEPA
jgi:chorismate mutase / prephenate dehydratase